MIRVLYYPLERLEPLGKPSPSSNEIHFTAAYLCEERSLSVILGWGILF